MAQRVGKNGLAMIRYEVDGGREVTTLNVLLK
jgi:hypothetical protein